jgi:4-hydroxybenzoate polyprenyltransferase
MISRLLRTSRPRFWMYVFGPYIVGALIGASNPQAYLSPLALLFAFFFLFPANLLIYGINDIFDYETDVLNSKKQTYEDLVLPDERRFIALNCAIFCLPFLALLWFVLRDCWWMMLGFLFFSICYSAPPIRAKSKPILDSMFNVLYIFPGAFGYFLTGGTHFSIQLFVSAWLWAMAMHAYSAVPDISADREAGVPTVATLLGLKPTLFFCGALYLGSALLSFSAISWLAVILTAVYSALIGLSIRKGTEHGVMTIYRVFPFVNSLAGAALWWFIAFNKPSFWPF